MNVNTHKVRRYPTPIWLLAIVLTVVASRPVASGDDQIGLQIYQRQCASCHGAAGEGVSDQYGKPLAGDLPLAELAELISETMPEDDAESCVGEDAEKVAAYIYDAFYSEAARQRGDRPRIELSRLTVRQYQNAVADLIGSFATAGNWDDQRGLRGEYFNDPRFRSRELERRDATIEFDFGEGSPEKGKINADEFSIRWQGVVIAPDTGEYEFVIRTENGVRLWVNDSERPLIDGWVRSGNEVEHRESIRLLGGRAYPLKLDLFKSKRGNEKSASISLLWKPPHGVTQLIPERNLSPNRVPELFVVTTPFPPDDSSIGYERGTAVSPEWDEATTHAAIEVAGFVVAKLPQFAGYRPGDANREQRVREFCHRFAERAFRRPLSDEQKVFFIDRHFDGADDVETAATKVVLLVLKSPRFLYHEIGSEAFDAYDVASRISFGLWDSLPDQPLLDAAANGQLSTTEQVTAQVKRMLPDLRTKAKLREFFHQWLRLDEFQDIAKDDKTFPEFDETTASDLRMSLELFLDEVAWSEASDFRQLLLADSLFVNGRLAALYGADLASDAPFQKVLFDARERVGLLSHPMLLSGLAYYSTSSPIHRGVFVSRSLLGRSLRPPREAVAPLAPDLHPDLTTRERVILQTSPMACKTCHGMINPLGFSLENYDAVGRYRTEENGKPIDASGVYKTLTGETKEFSSARELALFLAESPEAHTAFVRQLFHYFVKQPIAAYGPDQTEKLRESFANSEFSIQQLLIDIVTTAAIYDGRDS